MDIGMGSVSAVLKFVDDLKGVRMIEKKRDQEVFQDLNIGICIRYRDVIFQENEKPKPNRYQ